MMPRDFPIEVSGAEGAGRNVYARNSIITNITLKQEGKLGIAYQNINELFEVLVSFGSRIMHVNV
jgi:hypothetical protein